MNIIHTCRPKTGSITVSKVITGLPLDETFFHIVVTGQGAEPTIVDGYVSQSETITFDNLPFDTYVITEEANVAYTLIGIVSDTVVLSRSNRSESVVVTNELLVIETIKYGAMYNHYAITEGRGFAATGWGVMNIAEVTTFGTYLGGDAVGGGKLKETGLTYWDSPNTDATNEFDFNGRGTGLRSGTDGAFGNLKGIGCCRLSNAGATLYILNAGNDDIQYASSEKSGAAVRAFRVATEEELLLPDGLVTAIYTGNDGKNYQCTKVGTQIHTADYLNETKYQNGDSIPVVTDNAAWAALTTGAMCYYDNDINNA